MPYLLISTHIHTEVHPTLVGGKYSDLEQVQYLGASKRSVLGNNFFLDELKCKGFLVLSMTEMGQTLVWWLHKG
ncbi:unnamed protein product [Nyctereutes procyonoides]|uniref:GTP cyclohydrolase 1 feedback regulatory protein n=1 Tax=Nyctereutes procyonoides TaxID=34880 RepID=A0A811ZJH1_NYCPR|nr:unnamed protein product [Nyctereutes procyonoides]